MRGHAALILTAMLVACPLLAAPALAQDVDIVGRHAECATQVLSMPQLKLDLSSLWGKPDQVYLAMRVVYWHNKYGLTDLQDKLVLPVVIWVLQ